jgi:hypothetical protein
MGVMECREKHQSDYIKYSATPLRPYALTPNFYPLATVTTYTEAAPLF